VGVLPPPAVLAETASGTLWEIRMEMPAMPAMPGGMGFSMPAQTVCLPSDDNEAPPPDKGCTLLEKHSDGNHHFLKMQCPDGLMELDQTRSADAMDSQMKMTDRSGQVTEMSMKGKVLGNCDYRAQAVPR
jgi:hypothetical protein